MAIWNALPVSRVMSEARLDAEYYRPEDLALIEALDRLQPDRVRDFAYVTDGIHASPEVVPKNGIRYLSAKCVKDNDFVLEDTLMIAEAQHLANRRTQLRRDDVLVTTVGTIGNAAVVTDDFLPANADRHLGIIRIYDGEDVDPYYLSTFLNSRLGRVQTLREATGNVQLNLFIEKIKTLRVVQIGACDQVADLARRGYGRKRDSSDLFREAEEMLETSLALDADLTPHLCYARSYADVLIAGRFDAEYFQTAKKNALDALTARPGSRVGTEFNSTKDLWHPGSTRRGDRIRNFDLTDALQPFLDDKVEPVGAETVASTKKRMARGDVVVSRLRSYLKEIAVVQDTGSTPMVGSTEFIVLRPRHGGVRSEALLVYLRSRFVQTILKWCQDGSNHPRFHEDELLNLPLPDIVIDHQDDIAAKVNASIEAKQESHRLLDQAKHMVETAILGSN